MTISEIINHVLAGGLLGALGQGIRCAVGFKKFNEENSIKTAENKPAEEFSVSRMVVSFFTGFVAGAIGMLVKGSDLDKDGDYSTESIVTIIAIGYSGADFIEGVFNTYARKFSTSAAPAQGGEIPKGGSQTLVQQPLTVPDEANFSTYPAQG